MEKNRSSLVNSASMIRPRVVPANSGPVLAPTFAYNFTKSKIDKGVIAVRLMLIVVVMVKCINGNLSLSPPNCRDQCAFELVAQPAKISRKKLSFNTFMVF